MTNIAPKSLEELVLKLEELKAKIISINITHNRELFFETIEEVRKFITLVKSEELFESFYHSKRYKEFSDFFSHKVFYYMRAIEGVESMHMLRKNASSDVSFEDKMKGEFMKIRFETKIDDVKEIEMDEVRKFVMVGPGPLPDTILFLNENFDIPEIIGIDNNQEAVLFASEVVSSMGYKNVSIEFYDGLDYDYKDVDLIYVANFVPPKNKILDRIAETAPDHVQVIVESPVLMGRMLFEQVIPELLHPRLKIESERLNSTPYFCHKVLKIKKYNI